MLKLLVDIWVVFFHIMVIGLLVAPILYMYMYVKNAIIYINDTREKNRRKISELDKVLLKTEIEDDEND